jgi:hypothetical protein
MSKISICRKRKMIQMLNNLPTKDKSSRLGDLIKYKQSGFKASVDVFLKRLIGALFVAKNTVFTNQGKFFLKTLFTAFEN